MGALKPVDIAIAIQTPSTPHRGTSQSASGMRPKLNTMPTASTQRVRCIPVSAPSYTASTAIRGKQRATVRRYEPAAEITSGSWAKTAAARSASIHVTAANGSSMSEAVRAADVAAVRASASRLAPAHCPTTVAHPTA